MTRIKTNVRQLAVVQICLLFVCFASSLFAQDENYKKKFDELTKRTEWFRDARFGMFIHYGAYAIPARGEWVQSNEKISVEDYKPYVDAFKPGSYKPEEWAKLAKKAGMKYAVMTAKHHDGFCLFDTKLTDYKITTNMPGRDFVKEYLEAFRAEGLKVGLYYSLIDWHHKDYPNVGNHPMRDNKEWDKKKYNWDKYLEYMHAQIKELMTQYGKIDILWLDYSFDDYENEKWKAAELVKMIREYQPDIILNNRLVFNHGASSIKREFTGYGDYETPEQALPESDLVDAYGNSIPWETCLTLNNTWGYNATDNVGKTPEAIINALVNCVSKKGNLLLNVGPESEGTIPQQSVEILTEVGKWMDKNSESIYNCGPADLPKPEWGYFTKNGKNLYAHWTNSMIGHINIKNFNKEVEKVTVLTTGEPAAVSENWWGNSDQGNYFINVKAPTYLTFPLPDENDTVIKLELKEE